jgi:release factor glutamine methyltransferase
LATKTKPSTTLTAAAWLKQADADFRAAGIESARLDALVLLEHATGRERSLLLADVDWALPLSVESRLAEMKARRSGREPIAYIIGAKEFWGMNFMLTPDVLIPRPETEAMVAAALETAPASGRVLELGTGSGAVAVALKHERPDLTVEASDISAAALGVARANARKHGLAITFIHSDLLMQISGKFDSILANLPYVPVGARRQPELAYEPAKALYAGADGLDCYKRLISEAGDYLRNNGQIIIEAGPTQRAELSRLASAAGFKLRGYSEYVSILER